MDLPSSYANPGARPPCVTAYVDGSFFPPSHRYPFGRGGAGIIFGSDESQKHWVAVPFLEKTVKLLDQTHPLVNDSVRAELYAALVAVFLVRSQQLVAIRIKQDCVAALLLLKWALDHAEAPSRWIADRLSSSRTPETKQQLSVKGNVLQSIVIPVAWESQLTGHDIVNYLDVLDAWWFWTRNIHVSLMWVPGHMSSAHELAHKASKVKFSYDSTYAEADLKGNKLADRWARSACSAEAEEEVARGKCLHFPLQSPVSSSNKQLILSPLPECNRLVAPLFHLPPTQVTVAPPLTKALSCPPPPPPPPPFLPRGFVPPGCTRPLLPNNKKEHLSTRACHFAAVPV